MIRSFCTASKCLSNRQLKWELLKDEIQKFTVNYIKQTAKEKRQQRIKLENQHKILERDPDEDDTSVVSKYKTIKNELDTIYDHITEHAKSMQNDKYPGNNGLTKEIYETFWNDLKKILIDSLSKTKEKEHLSTSQRQDIFRLIEKKQKHKRFIQNWRPIFLLNVDLKIIRSKAL